MGQNSPQEMIQLSLFQEEHKAQRRSDKGIDTAGSRLDLFSGIVGERVEVVFRLWLTAEQNVQVGGRSLQMALLPLAAVF